MVAFKIFSETIESFDNEKIEGPEPEIPEAIAPLIFEIFIKLSNSGIKIRLFGSAIKSTIDLDIRSKSSVYKLLTNEPRLADYLTIFSISIFFFTTFLESDVFNSMLGLIIITSRLFGEGRLITSISLIDLTKVIPPKIIGATLSA